MSTSQSLPVLSNTDNLTNDDEDIIQFNIGGQFYSTKRSTINNNIDSQSFLALIIQNQTKTPLDDHGRYFIDRDGKYFRFILNYFREKTFRLPENPFELRELLSEVKFYQIDRLRNEIENRLNRTNEKTIQFHTGLQMTLMSRVNHNKTILKIIGPLKLITYLRISLIGERFLKIITSFRALETISCELIFPANEKLLSCQVYDQLERFVLTKQARKMGLAVSYCDDYFYIPIEREIRSRDELLELLFHKHNGKLLSRTMTQDDSYILVENWFLSAESDDMYSNASITSVH